MVKTNKSIITDVIQLAKINRIATEKESQEFSSMDNLEEILSQNEEEKKIEEYLLNLDVEIIKELMIIMYVGRDGLGQDISPEKCFENLEDYFNRIGWEDKGSMIQHMISKVPFDKYLINGCKLLNI
ncbi:hypothetical protein [Clostridium tertium]|uniref:hypothetical protein n=1 Tax=Clostridium tertium TaxID=1559 RepID=UPI002A828B2C|nr:hypothetical protein [Clostridium tertium]MDY4604004.1 hypothetical protein [Clostridium tertium]